MVKILENGSYQTTTVCPGFSRRCRLNGPLYSVRQTDI